MKTKNPFTFSLFSCALLLVAVVFSPAARAATYIVTNTDNDGAGSLRAAINAANSTPDDDTINFLIPGCENGGCTIGFSGNFGTTALNIQAAGALTIANSPNAANIGISANDTDRVFIVRGGANLTLRGISVVGGNSDHTAEAPFNGGGGIYNQGGTLTLINSAVAGNYSGSANGGAVSNYGSLTMTNSSVLSNQGNNAGIYNAATATLNDSRILNNNGVAVTCTGGSLNMNDSTVSGNLTAIYNRCVMSVTNSTISGQTQQDAATIRNDATLTLTSSTISDNAHGISNMGDEANGAQLRLINSIMNHNGNAKYCFAAITSDDSRVDIFISNSIISNNIGLITGAVFLGQGSMTSINSTIVRNYNTGSASGGIYNLGNISLRNTIVAENTILGDPSDINNGGTFVSQGNNLIGNSQDTNVSWQSSDILNQSPRLAPLGNYGGATQTFALLNNSPALNAGNNCVITANGCGDDNPALPTDQRGASRVGAVDIGAFELNNTANGGNYRAATPAGRVNVSFNYLLTSQSGAFSYSVTAGSLPPGLSLSNVLPPQYSPLKNSLLAPQAGAYSITGTPTLGGTFDYTITASDGASSVSTDYRTQIQAAPTAAGVGVGGRVINGSRGIANSQITLTDQNGQTRTARTSAFGYFRFENVRAGETYVISVWDKRHDFAPQVVSPTAEITGLIFAPSNNQPLLSNKTSK